MNRRKAAKFETLMADWPEARKARVRAEAERLIDGEAAIAVSLANLEKLHAWLDSGDVERAKDLVWSLRERAHDQRRAMDGSRQ